MGELQFVADESSRERPFRASPNVSSAWWSPRADGASTRPIVTEPDSESRAAFIALIVFTFIMLLAPQNWFPALAHLRIALMAGGTAIVCLLWDRWNHRKKVGLAREIVLCWALAAWALFTIPLSYWPGGSLSMLINVYLKALVILCLLAGVISTAQRLRFIAITLV